MCRDRVHAFSKPTTDEITLLAGLGVAGDAHQGVTVQHRSRVQRDPSQPNLRQAHLIHAELFDEIRVDGFDVSPGDLGENVTTRGIDLLALPTGTRLILGATAVLEVTGLRNPCARIDRFQRGLLARVLRPEVDGGGPVPRAGVMSIVLTGGIVRPGDAIRVEIPPRPHVRLGP